MLFRSPSFRLLSGLLLVLLPAAILPAQNGEFVIPSLRNPSVNSTAEFAYWDRFETVGQTNYNTPNPPALITGQDADGNGTNIPDTRTTILQTGSPSAFVTSSAGIYSFSDPTAFQVDYEAPVPLLGEVTNVIFQLQRGGSNIDVAGVMLEYDVHSGGGTQTFQVAPLFKALDGNQSGSFSARSVHGFQWDLTGLGIREFRIKFASLTSSLIVWQCQLDAVVGGSFAQELGYLLTPRTRPLTRFGSVGSLDFNVTPGAEDRFFLAGQSLTLLGAPEFDWESVGFIYQNVVYDTLSLPLVFPASDIEVTALFAPLTYDAWREAMFFHFNGLTGTPDDYLDDLVSGPLVDHDLDGLLNKAEYAFGCDPYVADSDRVGMQYVVVSVEGVDYPAVRFRRNGCPPDFSDIVWVVQVSTDMVTWMDNENDFPLLITEEVMTERQPDGTEFVTVRSSQPLSSFTKVFFKVEVIDF